MMRHRPWLRRLALSLGALLVLAGAAWTFWNYRASAALELAVEHLKAAGLPISPEQVRPPASPPEENAAPLLRAAFALLQAAPAHVHQIDVSLDVRSGVPQGGPEAIAAAAEALELVHRAVLKPRCDFQLDYEKGITMEMGHLYPLRRLAMLLAARAVLRAESADLAGAAGDVRAAFALGRALREEPILVSQLVRITIDDAALRALELILPRLESVTAALDAMAPDTPRGAIAFALRGEVAIYGLRLLEVDVLSNLDAILGEAGRSSALRLGWVAKPYFKTDLARLLGLLRACAEIAARPYANATPAWEAAMREGEREGGVLVRLFSVNIAEVLRQESAVAARAELARLAALCLEHRHQHGVYPESIAMLGAKAPDDPLAGKPFTLREEGGAPLLASEADAGVVWRLPKR